MIGNCLKYSRAVVSFDKSFDDEPHLQIYKEILTDSFGVPKNHPKSKPFIDHMFCFYWVDNRIWFRHYQVGFCLHISFSERPNWRRTWKS